MFEGFVDTAHVRDGCHVGSTPAGGLGDEMPGPSPAAQVGDPIQVHRIAYLDGFGVTHWVTSPVASSTVSASTALSVCFSASVARSTSA